MVPGPYYPKGAIWKWESETGWVCYNVDISSIIEDSYKQQNSTVSIKIGRWVYQLDFEAMTQKNKATGRIRRIYRDTQPSALWLWEESPLNFQRFDPDLELSLEKAFLAGAGDSDCDSASTFIRMDSSNAVYTVTLHGMEMKQMDTSKSYSVFRVIVSPETEFEQERYQRTRCNERANAQMNQQNCSPSMAQSSHHRTNGEQRISRTSTVGCAAQIPLLRLLGIGTKSAAHTQTIGAVASTIIRSCNLNLNALGTILEEGKVYCLGNLIGLDDSMKASILKEAPPQDDDCAICLEQLSNDVVKLTYCLHYFHIGCVEEYLKHGQRSGMVCPKCNTIQSNGYGPCPKGSMSWIATTGSIIEGYKNAGTIVILYHIPSGIQSNRHASPREPFDGTVRGCYLPCNKQGKLILKLLKRSFEAGHTFSVGTSITTGRNNSVIWNGIHHKTNTRGGPSRFGYPDDTYFQRVLGELKEKGIEPDKDELNDAVVNFQL